MFRIMLRVNAFNLSGRFRVNIRAPRIFLCNTCALNIYYISHTYLIHKISRERILTCCETPASSKAAFVDICLCMLSFNTKSSYQLPVIYVQVELCEVGTRV